MKILKSKRVLILIIVFALCFTSMLVLTACAKNNANVDNNPDDIEGFCDHEWADIIVKEPTCIDYGEKITKCTKCEKINKTIMIDPLGHDYVMHEKCDATCETDGWKAYKTCTRCTYNDYTPILATGHNFKTTVKKKLATCTTDGYDSHLICTYCGEPYGVPGIDFAIYAATGHDTIHHDKQDSTCTEVGWEAYDECKNCSFTTYQEIPMHHYGDNEICKDCDKSLWSDYFNLVLINGDEEYSVNGVLEGVVLPENVTIPDKHFNKPVTTISATAFKTGYEFADASKVKTVTIGENVKTIDASAFGSMTNLESLNVSNNSRTFKSINNCVVSKDTSTLVLGCKTSIIPDDGSVTSIGTAAFYNCSGLKGFTLPACVESIGDNAFYGCTGLTSVTIPSGVISIGNSAFYECSNVANLVIMSSVETIGDSAFSGCTGITELSLNGNLQNLGKYAFSSCTNLQKLSISGNDVVIGESAFFKCEKMTDLTLGAGIQSIGASAFSSCSGLTSIVIPASVQSIGGSAFYDCVEVASLTLGNNVESIGDSAFRGCGKITSLEIPASVQSIGKDAFFECKKLASVTISSNTLSIGAGAFGGCKKLNKTYVDSITKWCNIVFGGVDANPASMNNGRLFVGGELLTEAVIPDTITKIGDYQFENSMYLSQVTIPEGITNIGLNAFSGCSALGQIAFPTTVEDIKSDAFKGCAELEDVYVKDIAQWYGIKFGNVYSNPLMNSGNLYVDNALLTELVIPATMTNLDYTTFAGLANIEKITVESGNPKYHSDGNCVIETAYKNVVLGCMNSVIPNDGSATYIAAGAFFGCNSLKSITIPDSITEIDYDAFGSCPNLESITIGAGLRDISAYYFKNCDNISRLTVSASNASMKSVNNCIISKDEPTLMFACKGSVLPTDGTINRIGRYAFGFGSTPESITVPDIVTTIDSYAFYYCSNLKTLDTGAGVELIDQYTAFHCLGLNRIIIGKNVLRICDYGIYGCDNLATAKFVFADLWYRYGSIDTMIDVPYIGLDFEIHTKRERYHPTPSQWTNRERGSSIGVLNEKENAEIIKDNDWLYRRDSSSTR